MKRSRICPECGSQDIHVTEIHARQSGMDMLPKTGGVFHRAVFDVYICGNCGYYRLFVSESDLANVIEKLPELGAV